MTQINTINTPILAPQIENVAPQNVGGGAGVQPPMIPHNLTHPQQALRQGAQLFNIQPLRELIGQVVADVKDLSLKIGRWFHEVSVPRAGLPETVAVRMPNGHSVLFRGEELAPMIKALPRLQREEARANLASGLEQRMTGGKALLDKIINDTYTGTATSQEVADLMLFISSSAKITGADFSKGAFNIEDPHCRLANFLYSCPDVYQRSSSHMQTAQHSTVDERLNTHRGIDIAQGLTGLPNNHATLLFARIPSQNGEPNRTYLKLETHGCRLNTLRAADRDINAEDRPYRASDFLESIGHGMRYFLSRGTSNAAGSRKEHIPDNVKREYRDLTRQFEDTDYHRILTAGNPLDNSSGIRTMVANLRNLAQATSNDNEQFENFKIQTVNFRIALSNLAEVNDLTSRIGNEVTRTLMDLSTITDYPQLSQIAKLEIINRQIGMD